jgi:hypothetical protein
MVGIARPGKRALPVPEAVVGVKGPMTSCFRIQASGFKFGLRLCCHMHLSLAGGGRGGWRTEG